MIRYLITDRFFWMGNAGWLVNLFTWDDISNLHNVYPVIPFVAGAILWVISFYRSYQEALKAKRDKQLAEEKIKTEILKQKSL